MCSWLIIVVVRQTKSVLKEALKNWISTLHHGLNVSIMLNKTSINSFVIFFAFMGRFREKSETRLATSFSLTPFSGVEGP